MRDYSAALAEMANTTPAAELPTFIGALEAAKAAAWARLTPAPNGNGSHPELEENLSAAQAARRLGLSKDYLYRHAGQLPFTVKVGRRVLFSARGLERWNQNRMGR